MIFIWLSNVWIILLCVKHMISIFTYRIFAFYNLIQSLQSPLFYSTKNWRQNHLFDKLYPTYFYMGYLTWAITPSFKIWHNWIIRRFLSTREFTVQLLQDNLYLTDHFHGTIHLSMEFLKKKVNDLKKAIQFTGRVL